MKTAAELAIELLSLPAKPLSATFARRIRLAPLLGLKTPITPATLVAAKQAPDLLWSTDGEYRFNPPGIRTLYLGEGESTAAAEVKQEPGLEGFDVKPAAPAALFHVEATVEALLDVTDPAVQKALGTTEAELLSAWRLKSPNAPTQVLGQSVFASGRFEGIRYRSAPLARVGATGYCVALFRERKHPKSIVRIADPAGEWRMEWS